MISLAAENGMVQVQRAFANAIFFDDSPVPASVRRASGPAHASRFGVYRNNVVTGLINAIAARYPVVRRLLWEETFNRVAHLYVMAEPPRCPVLLEYGETFPQFLRGAGGGASADYLADVAELESARTRAYHAADASPLSREAFAALAADVLPAVRLRLHPSATLLKSRFPVVTVWEANRRASDNIITFWKAEDALIARPHDAVEVWRLPPGGYEFLGALAEGCSIGQAAGRGMAGAQNFDLAECFRVLIAVAVELARKPEASRVDLNWPCGAAAESASIACGSIAFGHGAYRQ
jgi:hypothetical protein